MLSAPLCVHCDISSFQADQVSAECGAIVQPNLISLFKHHVHLNRDFWQVHKRAEQQQIWREPQTRLTAITVSI